MAIAKVLLVDDDENVRFGLGELLESRGFDITTAASVPEALKLIISETYDVLLSDLHMPGAGDGLTVVSAMRHANPRAVTLLLTAYPEMGAATHAILLQADQILVKPMKLPALVEVIKQRLASRRPGPRAVESVATILERSAQSSIDDWFGRVQLQDRLMAVPLSYEQRCGHLPQVFRDLVYRLRSSQPLGTREVLSIAAAQHGVSRREYGYTAAMLVEESRMLQVSIFQTLQNNLANIDFSVLLIGVMTIADEVDSQLSQAMESYLTHSS
jgi:CheY-like chemotaxis protein